MTQQLQTKASQFFDAAADTFSYLYGRWQDEKEFEDIGDYAKPLEPIAKQFGVTIVKMTKRPFGCEFKTDIGKYVIKLTATTYGYQKLKA